MLSLRRCYRLPAATTAATAAVSARYLPVTAATIPHPSLSLPIHARVHASALLRSSPPPPTNQRPPWLPADMSLPLPSSLATPSAPIHKQQQWQHAAATNVDTATAAVTPTAATAASDASSLPPTAPPTDPHAAAVTPSPSPADPTLTSWTDMLLLAPIPGVKPTARLRLLLFDWLPRSIGLLGGAGTAAAIVFFAAPTADMFTRMSLITAIGLTNGWVLYAACAYKLHKWRFLRKWSIIPIPAAATVHTPTHMRRSGRIIDLSSLTPQQRGWYNIKFIIKGFVLGLLLTTAISSLRSGDLTEEPLLVAIGMTNAYSHTQSLCIGLLAPAAEELFYRGIVFARLIRVFGARVGIALGGFFFGTAHATKSSDKVLEASVMGAVLCYCYYRTQTLIVPIAVHALSNILGLQLYEAISPLQPDAQLRMRLDPGASTPAKIGYTLSEVKVQLQEWLHWTKMKLTITEAQVEAANRVIDAFNKQLAERQAAQKEEEERRKAAAADAHTGARKAVKAQINMRLKQLPPHENIYALLFEDATADFTPTRSSTDRSSSSSSSSSDSKPTELLRLRAEVREYIHTLFNRLDCGSKGYLTPAEFAFIDSLDSQRLTYVQGAEAAVNRVMREKNVSNMRELVSSGEDVETSLYMHTFERLSSPTAGSTSATAATAAATSSTEPAGSAAATATSSSPLSTSADSIALPHALASALLNGALNDDIVSLSLFHPTNDMVQRWQYEGASEREKNHAEYAHMRAVLMRRYYQHLESGVTRAFVRLHTALWRKQGRLSAATTATTTDGTTIDVPPAACTRELFTEYMRRQLIVNPHSGAMQITRAAYILDGKIQHPVAKYFLESSTTSNTQ